MTPMPASAPWRLYGRVLAVLFIAVVPIEQAAGDQEADEGPCRRQNDTGVSIVKPL